MSQGIKIMYKQESIEVDRVGDVLNEMYADGWVFLRFVPGEHSEVNRGRCVYGIFKRREGEGDGSGGGEWQKE